MGLFRRSMGRRQLQREGTRADAEIIDIHFTNTKTTHGPVFEVKLAVRAPGGTVFETDGKINASMISPPAPGQVIPIRYDPGQPSAFIWDEEEGKRRHQQAAESRGAQAMRDMSDPG